MDFSYLEFTVEISSGGYEPTAEAPANQSTIQELIILRLEAAASSG